MPAPTFQVKAMADLRCSFCDKSQADVQKVIVGNKGVSICNECVEACNDILADAPGRPPPSSSDEYVIDGGEPSDLFSFRCPACGHQWKAARTG